MQVLEKTNSVVAKGAQVCAWAAFAPGLAFSRGPQGWRQLPCQCFQALQRKSRKKKQH